MKKPELTNLEGIPPHMRMDYERRNKNILDGKNICDHCDGTGNELLSMYRQCPKCNGSGQSPTQTGEDEG